MAIFSKCEVAAGPHGQQVRATAPVDPGTALVVDEEVIFAVECQHMQARCALCCCVCEEEVTGVACKACDARCAKDPACNGGRTRRSSWGRRRAPSRSVRLLLRRARSTLASWFKIQGSSMRGHYKSSSLSLVTWHE